MLHPNRLETERNTKVKCVAAIIHDTYRQMYKSALCVVCECKESLQDKPVT